MADRGDNTNPPTHDWDEVFERIRHGDVAAFGAFYDEMAPLIHGVSLRVLRNPLLAQESTQETFVQLWQQAPNYRASTGSVRSWACTIAHRRAVDCVRSDSARQRRETALTNDPTSAFASLRKTPAPESELIDNERATAVALALDAISVSQREAIELAYFNGLTYREVAEVLELPAGTVKTRIRDGLKQLRRLVDPELLFPC